MWVIFLFCLVSIFFDFFLSFSKQAIDHRYFIWNIFSIVEYLFIGYFFYIILDYRLIRVLIWVFSLFYLLYFLFYLKFELTKFDSQLSAVESVLFLILSLVYFMNIMKPTVEPAKNIFTPVFLIVVGLLLFVSSTLFLFVVTSYLSEKEMAQFWIINTYANILTSFIFSAAFLLLYIQKKSPPPENRYVDFTSQNDR
jgi:hypothetical protein